MLRRLCLPKQESLWVGIALILALSLGVRSENQVQAARRSTHDGVTQTPDNIQVQQSPTPEELEQVVTSGLLVPSKPLTKQEMLAARPAPRPEEMDLPPFELTELPLAKPTGSALDFVQLGSIAQGIEQAENQ